MEIYNCTLGNGSGYRFTVVRGTGTFVTNHEVEQKPQPLYQTSTISKPLQLLTSLPMFLHSLCELLLQQKEIQKPIHIVVLHTKLLAGWPTAVGDDTKAKSTEPHVLDDYVLHAKYPDECNCLKKDIHWLDAFLLPNELWRQINKQQS